MSIKQGVVTDDYESADGKPFVCAARHGDAVLIEVLEDDNRHAGIVITRRQVRQLISRLEKAIDPTPSWYPNIYIGHDLSSVAALEGEGT